MSTATAADIPGRYDVLLNGQGYCFADSIEPSMPFRIHRALYDISPTFIERTNTGGKYGDSDQDFFLTLSQNDWSLGEAQRFYRSTDSDRVRRYWKGTNVETFATPGQVTIRNAVGSLTFAGAVTAVAESNSGTTGVYATSSTNLYLVDKTGTITDKGAHGVGAAPSQWGLVTDGSNVYVSTTTAGTVGVRKWNGTTWSTFSATGADSLAYLNNQLYGFSLTTGLVGRYDSSGGFTSIYPWKDASGAALTGSSYQTRLRAFGGKLYMLRTTGVRKPGELWQYDGTTTSELAEFPANFVAKDFDVIAGITFIGGYFTFNSYYQPAVYYYVNGQTGLLWRTQLTNYTNQTWPAIAGYGDGIVFTDDSTGRFLQYNVATGGVQCVGTYTATNATGMAAANTDIFLHTRASTTGYYLPTTATSSTATLQSSLFDFDNSLTKIFRGIVVDWSAFPGDTAGASVDIAYQTDNLDGSYTNLQTGATSGTEYNLSGITGRTISVRLTLNKGASTYGPIVKRLYVRAAPQLKQYRNRTYVLDCTGTMNYPRKLRDGSYETLTGYELVQNLMTLAQQTTPFSVTDRLGTYSACLVDLQAPQGFDVLEVHPAADDPTRDGSFLVRVTVREV